MILGIPLFLSLFHNSAIFIVLVTLYSYVYNKLEGSNIISRQVAFGFLFGLFAVFCMYAKIPVAEGVIVDQRNTIVALSGAFGGPFSAVICGFMAGIYRVYLGGSGVLAGVIGVGLSALAGIGIYLLRDKIDTLLKGLIASILATIIILPGFMFYENFQKGWSLTKTMALPYGSAIFVGLFLLGLLLVNQEHRHAEEKRRQKAEKDLSHSENYYRTLFETSGSAMFIIESDTAFSLVNSNFEELSGYTSQEMEGIKSWTEFFHPEDVAWMTDYHYLRRRDPEAAPRQYECRFINRQGEMRHLFLSVDMIPETSQSIASGVDFTEHKRAEESVYNLAYFDKLTGLPNRELFLELLGQAVSRSEHFEECGAVVLVNIEKLKSVNDALGEQAGNELIREVGRRIRGVIRDGDTIARVAGDEFMILAERIDTGENVRNLGQSVLERVGEELELSHRRIYPEASIGFTLFPHGATNPDSLIKQADMALTGAKKSANRIQQFAGDEEGISREFHLEQDLRSALANEEFWLCYQPQIDLQSGKTVGLEALIRWSHSLRGTVSPGEFIPLLERSGMIASVDAWVVRRVCEQLRFWRDAGFSVRASVNLSARDLAHDSIVGVISSALEENRLPADALSVELTETDLMENVDRASRILQTLSSWGVRVALDDFGKGYSSLSYLQKLAINTIKIDKQFVDGLPDNQDSVTLVQTIIAMAHNLGKKVLAEGVERRDQWEKLLELGCDYGQGFLWGRPQPPEALKF